MSFSTFEFIIVFLPVFLVIYYTLLKLNRSKASLANIWLIIGSLAFVFYADYVSGHYYNTLILVLLGIYSFLMARGISFLENKESYILLRKALFIAGITVILAVLFVYKYYVKILPLGISFYSFTMIAYLADIYNRRVKAEDSIVKYFAYICMFPKLFQGPITRYSQFSESLEQRNINIRRFDRALKLFIMGLAMKVLLADKVGLLFFEIEKIGFESISTPLAWMGAVAFSLQLYFDFCGYTLMAMGLGNMLGFRIPVNFDSPYASRSVSEFYRRWHITLGKWFRDYIYIPLGGNRKGVIVTLINLFVVWLLTGVWHGRSLNFLIWAGILFVFIALEKLFLNKLLYKTKVLSRIYLIFVIVVSWVTFAITDVTRLWIYITRMFPFINAGYESNVLADDYIKYCRMYGPIMLIAIVLCIPKVYRGLLAGRRKTISSFLCILLFVLSLFAISKGMNNPFMYFDF